MDAAQLKETLKAGGHTLFVSYFDWLTDPALDSQLLADRIMAETPYERTDLMNKIAAARRIIKAGQVREALRLVANNHRTKPNIKE